MINKNKIWLIHSGYRMQASDYSKLPGIMSKYMPNIGIHDSILLIKQLNLILEVSKNPKMEVKAPKIL